MSREREARYLVSAVCFAGSAAIIISGGDVGWGWLLFFGFITLPS